MYHRCNGQSCITGAMVNLHIDCIILMNVVMTFSVVAAYVWKLLACSFCILVYQSVQLSAQTMLICKLDLMPLTIVSSVLFGYPEQLTHPCHSESYTGHAGWKRVYQLLICTTWNKLQYINTFHSVLDVTCTVSKIQKSKFIARATVKSNMVNFHGALEFKLTSSYWTVKKSAIKVILVLLPVISKAYK